MKVGKKEIENKCDSGGGKDIEVLEEVRTRAAVVLIP